jgi:hypothetical protein
MRAMTDEETDEEGMPTAKFYSQMELRLTTLRALCLERDPDSHDAELCARYAELFEMWASGPDSPFPAPQGKFRKFNAKHLVAGCDMLLRKLAEEGR